MEALERRLRAQELKVNRLTESVTNDHDKMQILIDTVIKQDQRIHELTKELDEIKLNAVNDNIIISGLIEGPGENVILQVKEFFHMTMKIQQEIPIDDAYRLGAPGNRQVVVKLKYRKDKKYIFRTRAI